MGRPLSVFTLSEAEEETLRSLARRRTTAQALVLRARIVLACAAGDPNQVVAGKLGVTPQTVCKWRARFVAQRLDGLKRSASSQRPSNNSLSLCKLRELLVKAPPLPRMCVMPYPLNGRAFDGSASIFRACPAHLV